ncbi:MAG TPA: hypothetical protein VMW35_19630 [Myxococcota bacterium]|jgi:hypothetical protein|nr:hypothetical protein [Myxococcota bacterium]
MYRKFLNARSPMRLLEKGLHGGLGAGNLGVILAGRGVGKSAFLVGVALDELLRGQPVLHVSLGDGVAHVRAYYDTVFDDLAASTHLDGAAATRAEIERRRSIRSYPASGFSAAKLREALKIEGEAGAKPTLVIVEGYELDAASRDEVLELKALAGELGAELWLSAACPGDKVQGVPPSLARVEDAVSVILALEPAEGSVRLRALKDHDNPDVSALHVALDPRTLLLVRS